MEPGTQLGHRYQLTQWVDTGRLGEIWRATDSIFDRTVIVTVLHAFLSNDQQFRDKFRHDATAIARLDSPHIVELLDYSEEWRNDELVTFVVTEDLQDDRLCDVLDHGPLEASRTDEIIDAIAQAVHTAHAAQIVHGRISPHVIAFRGDTPVLTEFGVAAVNAPGLGDEPYLSPEQLADEPPTTKSDIYALGATTYACLAGRPPFLADTRDALLETLADQAPPSVPKNCPTRLEPLITLGIVADPHGRIADAATLTQRLRDGGSITEQESGTDAASDPVPGPAPPLQTPNASEIGPPHPGHDPADSETTGLEATPTGPGESPGPDTDEHASTVPVPTEDAPMRGETPGTAVMPQAHVGVAVVRDSTDEPPASQQPPHAHDEPDDTVSTAPTEHARTRRRLIVVAAVVALVVALFLVRPWQFFDNVGHQPSGTSPAASGPTQTTAQQSDSARSHSPRPTTKAPPPNNPTQLPEPTTTEPARTTVPNVVGSPPSVAVATLTGAEFNVQRNENGVGEVECQVMMQEPEAGATAQPGTTVTIWYLRAYDERFCRQ